MGVDGSGPNSLNVDKKMPHEVEPDGARLRRVKTLFVKERMLRLCAPRIVQVVVRAGRCITPSINNIQYALR